MGPAHGKAFKRWARVVVRKVPNLDGPLLTTIYHNYERFYRVDKSRSRHAGGSGLGLAIVKHIIEAHGQSIQVQSALNKGTAFSFELVNLDAEAEKRNIQLDAPDLV